MPGILKVAKDLNSSDESILSSYIEGDTPPKEIGELLDANIGQELLSQYGITPERFIDFFFTLENNKPENLIDVSGDFDLEQHLRFMNATPQSIFNDGLYDLTDKIPPKFNSAPFVGEAQKIGIVSDEDGLSDVTEYFSDRFNDTFNIFDDIYDEDLVNSLMKSKTDSLRKSLEDRNKSFFHRNNSRDTIKELRELRNIKTEMDGDAEEFADGGYVDEAGNQMEQWMAPGQFNSVAGFKLPNADANMNLSAEDFSKLQEYFARPDYDHTGSQGMGTPYYTDANGYAWMPQRTGAVLGPEGYYDPGMITGYYRGAAPGTDQTLTHGNVLRGFDMKGEHTGDWKHERESMWQTLAPILSVVAPALGGIFAPALSSLTTPVTTALTEAGLPSWLANAVPGAVGKGALSQLSGGDFWDGATGSFLGAGMGAGVDGLGLDPGMANIVKSLAGPALRGQNPLTPANLMKLAAPR